MGLLVVYQLTIDAEMLNIAKSLALLEALRLVNGPVI
jgi:hypothetical protein